MTKSESIEALLSPSLRVSRPVAACSRCRGAKIKCDGKLPACTACEKSGKASSCSGANDEFAKGKERSYVAALEAAAERLQRKIAEARPAASPTATAKTSSGFAGLSSIGNNLGRADPLPRTVGGGRARRKEASDVDDLVGDFGFLSVNATSRDFHGFTSTMSFARLLLSVSMVADLPTSSSNPLPPRYVATSLIQKYLDNIFVLMPFFSEIDLMSSVSAVYQESGRHARPSDYWFVHMVLAISSAAASRSKGDSNDQAALRHAAAAIAHVEAVLHPGSISGIQALLLLVQYSMVEPEYFRSWDLIGMASRVMVDLGLHVEPSPESKMNKEALDMRRKVFYCVYTLDRNISIAYGRAFSLTDDSATVSLPVSGRKMSPETDRDPNSELFLRSLKPSLFLFDIRRVQSTFYQITHCSLQKEWLASTASEYTTSILQDIRSWFATIPASLSQQHLVYFRLESLYSQILALSPSCRIPSSRMADLSKTMIFELAIQYVDQLMPVVKDASWHPFLTYVDFLRVNTVGRQYREALWTNFDQLLMGGIAHSPEPSTGASNAQPPPPPFIRSTSPLENCYRAITCFESIIEILAYARQRWGPGIIREKFAQESAVLMGKLKNRQRELSTPPYYDEGLSYPTNQSAQEPQPNSTRSQSGPIVVGLQQSQQHLDSRAATDWSHSQQDVQQSQLLRSVSHEYPLSYGQQDMQQPQILRTSSHENPAERPGMYGLPSGSQPRRSYEFLGGQEQRRRNAEGTQ